MSKRKPTFGIVEEIEYIPMEPDFRLGLEARYRRPFRNNALVSGTVMVLMLSAILLALTANYKDRQLHDGNTPENLVAYRFVIIAFISAFLVKYIALLYFFSKRKLHYLKDFKFGFILKERMTVSRVFPTPAGINIYWLDHPGIRTFTPDPYRRFREGDQVFIYYLKYSKEYLAYEI